MYVFSGHHLCQCFLLEKPIYMIRWKTRQSHGCTRFKMFAVNPLGSLLASPSVEGSSSIVLEWYHDDILFSHLVILDLSCFKSILQPECNFYYELCYAYCISLSTLWSNADLTQHRKKVHNVVLHKKYFPFFSGFTRFHALS